MNIQRPDIPEEYARLQYERTLLSRQPELTVKDLQHIISLAKRCSKLKKLSKTKKEECQDVVKTWEVSLNQFQKERKEK